MDDLAGRHGACPAGIEEADKFAMAMRRHAAPEDGAVQDIERGANSVVMLVAFVVVRQGPASLPGLSGRPGWVRSRAWICDFVDRPHHGMGRGLHVEAECRGRRYPRPSPAKAGSWWSA